jgi:hypothetical protein
MLKAVGGSCGMWPFLWIWWVIIFPMHSTSPSYLFIFGLLQIYPTTFKPHRANSRTCVRHILTCLDTFSWLRSQQIESYIASYKYSGQPNQLQQQVISIQSKCRVALSPRGALIASALAPMPVCVPGILVHEVRASKSKQLLLLPFKGLMELQAGQLAVSHPY